MRPCFLPLVLVALCASAQTATDMASDAHHQLLIENSQVRLGSQPFW